VRRAHRVDGDRDDRVDPCGDDRHGDDGDQHHSVTSGLAEALIELQTLTETLRRECPWDREQTARTIVPHTVEEAYEVADAAAAGDDGKLIDELGDLLFQVYFLALTLQEKDYGSLEDVARGAHSKLVRRHPHVFGDEAAESAGDVRLRWERIKRDQEGREGVFHDVPENLPALLRARKVQRRARAVGFEYPDLAGAVADLDDEIAELKAELGDEPAAETEPDPRHVDELGDVLFAAVNVARRLNVDPELALRAATDRFRLRVERAEELAEARGESWTALPLAEQDRYFDEAKGESSNA
jgi:XTP/dITP diphosphohydrolase/tetrapyrrole methylase family protein/MazG family protein/ATP diphosphatase